MKKVLLISTAILCSSICCKSAFADKCQHSKLTGYSNLEFEDCYNKDGKLTSRTEYKDPNTSVGYGTIETTTFNEKGDIISKETKKSNGNTYTYNYVNDYDPDTGFIKSSIFYKEGSQTTSGRHYYQTDDQGRITSDTYYWGTERSVTWQKIYTYDGNTKTEEYYPYGASSPESSYVYTYNDSGDLVREVRYRNGSTDPYMIYEYNYTDGQLVSQIYTNPQGRSYTSRYQYNDYYFNGKGSYNSDALAVCKRYCTIQEAAEATKNGGKFDISITW